MLSVILYGRNDSHGYNLHKRAAISLNAIAHLLSDPADEIIFVDYNTPDDLPTFPEAIADTLTAKAVEKLRILRVRPGVHNERFAAKTHLVALEPIARNVAIRRTNPANKWVLSTNTDMIFVPRHDGQDLTTAIGALKDGFYHLPRFELPEGLWETLDRKDPVGLIEGAKEWGERFHLNEIILSGNDNLYDGPGDFQLFLRDDLFRIGGFHEEMIRGWHLDANVAKRMRILRGEVSTALPALIGYHCDHTRQATAYHKGDRVENSAAIFVDNIFEPQVRDQMTNWGLPEVEIEELKLGQASGARYLRGLEAAVHGRLEGFLQAEYVPEAYGRLQYDPSHVLPYLLDLVSCIPNESKIGYVGARADMFAAFATAWTAMGAAEPVRAPDIAPWLVEAGGVAQPLQQWLDETDLFIFEVGAEAAPDQASLSEQERARLWAVDYGFKAATQHDRQRQAAGAAPRRTLVVNAIHNFFEPQIFTSISVTLTPFSSRIRHGYFTDSARAAMRGADEAGRECAMDLGALQPLSKVERADIAKLLASISGSGDRNTAIAGRLGAEIACLARGRAPELANISERVLESVSLARPSTSVKMAAHLVAPDAGRDAASRLTRIEDWENPEWLKLAQFLFANRAHHQLRERDPWVWERVTLAQNLRAAAPESAKVLLVGTLPEAFAFALAALDYEVDIVSPASLAAGNFEAIDWRRDFDEESWMHRKRVGLASEREQDFQWDAVILCQNSLFANGRAGVADTLRGATQRLRPGGHVGLSARAQLLQDETSPHPESLAPGLVANGAIVNALANLVGLEPVGATDFRMTPRSFDRLAAVEYPSGEPPALVIGAPPHIETMAVIAARKQMDGAAPDWDAFARSILGGGYEGQARPMSAPPAVQLAEEESAASATGGRMFMTEEVRSMAPAKGRRTQPHFGPIADRLMARDGIVKTPVALHIPALFGEELAATADVGELEPGEYEIYLEGRAGNLRDAGNVLAVGIVGAGRLLVEHVEPAAASGPIRVSISFEVDEEVGRLPGGVRLGVKGLGLADLVITELILR